MSGTLTKKLIQTTVKYAAVAGSPGFAGSPEVQGAYRYICKPVTTCREVAIGSIGNTGVSVVISTAGPCVTTTVCGNTWVPYQPARPPVPAVIGSAERVVSSLNTGWTGGGRSVDIMVEGGVFLVTIPRAVAVVVGLTEADQTTLFSEALHAFYILRDEIRVVEKGITAYFSQTHLHTASNIYGIGRSGNQINYLINGEIVYSSASRSPLPLMLDASLFVAGDTVVIQPLSLESSGQINGSMHGLFGLIGTTARAQIDGVLLPVEGGLKSYPRGHINGQMAALLGILGKSNYAQIDAAMLPLTGALVATDFAPIISSIEGEMLPLVGALTHSIYISGTIEASMAPLLGRLANGNYAEINASMRPLEAELWPEDGSAYMFSGLAYQSDIAAQHILSVAFSSGFAVVSVMAANEILTADMQSGISAGLTATLQSLHGASMTSGIGFSSANTASGYDNGQRSATAWVTNLDTGAVSMYAGFDFDRMYELDGKYYGVRDTNTYLLDGETDNGAPIDAFVAFGKQTFGTTALKHVPNFYAGISSTGVLLLRVTTGADTYTYQPRRTDALSQTQRYDLGKGLRANYYEFELFNQNG